MLVLVNMIVKISLKHEILPRKSSFSHLKTSIYNYTHTSIFFFLTFTWNIQDITLNDQCILRNVNILSIGKEHKRSIAHARVLIILFIRLLQTPTIILTRAYTLYIIKLIISKFKYANFCNFYSDRSTWSCDVRH